MCVCVCVCVCTTKRITPTYLFRRVTSAINSRCWSVYDALQVRAVLAVYSISIYMIIVGSKTEG